MSTADFVLIATETQADAWPIAASVGRRKGLTGRANWYEAYLDPHAEDPVDSVGPVGTVI